MQNVSLLVFQKGDCSCKIEYAYDLPNLQDEKVHLVYEVYGDGKIIVDMSYQPVVSEIEMPVFGLIFQLYKDMEEVNYYGFGPEENYIDRNKGGTSWKIYLSSNRQFNTLFISTRMW